MLVSLLVLLLGLQQIDGMDALSLVWWTSSVRGWSIDGFLFTSSQLSPSISMVMHWIREDWWWWWQWWSLCGNQTRASRLERRHSNAWTTVTSFYGGANHSNRSPSQHTSLRLSTVFAISSSAPINVSDERQTHWRHTVKTHTICFVRWTQQLVLTGQLIMNIASSANPFSKTARREGRRRSVCWHSTSLFCTHLDPASIPTAHARGI